MHPGPTPSRLPDPVDHGEELTCDEVAMIMMATCWRKKAYRSQGQARRDAARLAARDGVAMAHYRCAVHTMHEGKHWHVGHAPSQEHVERYALAIRWVTAHPDELPVPPEGMVPR